MTLWIYKLTYDTGAAPHVYGGVLSLAICKPRIRAGAVPGDWIFGFGGRSRAVIGGERLIYPARVTQKLDRPGEYYERREYRDRWDCIYQRRGEQLVSRPGSVFHPDNTGVQRDLGPAPQYPKAVVLLSDDFRYLGADGTMDYRSRWPDLGTFVHELGIGHRNPEPTSNIGQMLMALQHELWNARPAGAHGSPTESDEGPPAWSRDTGLPRRAPSGCGR